MKTLLNNIRWLLYNLFIRKVLFAVSLKYTVKDKAVFFILKSNTSHRYFLNLCHFFVHQGIEVVIRPSLGFLGHWQTSEFIRQLPQVRYAFICNGDAVVISDHVLTEKNYKTLRFDYFAFTPQRNSYLVPMCMVDTMYYFSYYKEADGLSANTNRNIKVFYAGNSATSYSNPIIRKKFGILDRVGIFKILKFLAGDQLYSIERINTFLEGEALCDLLILERNTHPIPPDNFLKFLSQCFFIVVPPGVVMPQTHFIVEGMAVGCIPILQYRKMFYPPLEHLKNCLYFDDEKGLEEIVTQAINMSAAQVTELRSNVLEYYSRFLSPASVVKNVLDPAVRDIYLNAEAESVKLI